MLSNNKATILQLSNTVFQVHAITARTSMLLYIIISAKEIMFLVALLCLSSYLSVSNITQQVMNGL